MKIEMYYLTLRQRCQFQSWSRKKQYLFSHAYIMSRHVPCMALQLTWKHLVYKQLNWRIHEENLSQAVNNGSWYKLSLLEREDAMIVPATLFTAFEDLLKTHKTWALDINIITSGFTNWALAK